MAEKLIKERLPRHIAIILDGNGRWAESRNLLRAKGHIEGVKRVEEIIDMAQDLGIGALTLFTFSTENWNRPETEVALIMKILTTVLDRKVSKLVNNDIRFQTIGRRDRVPESVLTMMDMVIDKTKNNTGLIVNLAFNYGSRLEIVDAVTKIANEVKDGKIDADQIDEELISKNLYTHDLPDPDLLIRTSGELRISNFLLWQLSYAEFYFTEKFWPDFTENEFKKALLSYQKRNRRFGNLAKAESES